MRKGFNLLLLLLLCFALSGCSTNYENKDVTNKYESSESLLISDELIENLSATKTAVVKSNWEESSKTITDIKEIDEIIEIISQATNVVGDITYEGARYSLEMYDIDNKLIDVIEIFNEYIRFESNITPGYNLNMEDLIKIIKN